MRGLRECILVIAKVDEVSQVHHEQAEGLLGPAQGGEIGAWTTREDDPGRGVPFRSNYVVFRAVPLCLATGSGVPFMVRMPSVVPPGSGNLRNEEAKPQPTVDEPQGVVMCG